MITKINEFKRIYRLNEEIGDDSISTNSEKSIKLDRLKKEIDYYNSNKNKLASVTGYDREDWEDKASGIIDGNTYLGIYWKFVKADYDAGELEKSIKNSELNDEEISDIRKDISNLEDKAIEYKKQAEDKIKEDTEELNKQ